MDRLISEKAVLEAFREYQGSISDFYKAIKAIPSAEPKIVPIAEVKFDDDMLHKIVEEAVKNIEIEPKWIPVSERLPEDHDWYVIVVKEKSTGYQYIPRIASHNHDNCWSIIDTEDADKDWLDDLECIAWMPLPQPYKGESEEV